MWQIPNIPNIGLVVQFQTNRMRIDGENYEYTVLSANDSFEMLGSRRYKLVVDVTLLCDIIAAQQL